MKIRTGFVSNSSSSSFVLLCTEEIHQNVLKKFDDDQQIFINEHVKLNIVFGKTLRVLSDLIIMDNSSWETLPHPEGTENVNGFKALIEYKSHVRSFENLSDDVLLLWQSR